MTCAALDAITGVVGGARSRGGLRGCCGPFDPGSYPGIREFQRQTWRAQDAVNLVVAVVLVLAARRAATGSTRAHLVRVGLLAWLTYCYVHLAFKAPFEPGSSCI